MWRKMKKWAAGGMASLLLFGLVGTSAFAAESSESDITGHWAEKTLSAWASSGKLNGYEDGSYRPNEAVSRGELFALINREYALADQDEVEFKDLAPTHWAYADATIAVKAGYAKGYEDGTIRTGNKVTKQEAAVMLARIAKLDVASATAAQFTDASELASWGGPSVAALANAKLVKGYADGSFQPNKALTRAEAVTMIQNVFEYGNEVYDTEGVYGPATEMTTLANNVVIDAPGVTLQNTVINGNLTITKNVGEGDVYLKNVKVLGSTFVQGGGVNSIHLEDTVLLTVIVDKQTGAVRIVATGESSVKEVTIQSEARVEAGQGAKINSVTLSDKLPDNSRIILAGHFETVNIEASSIRVRIPEGSVGSMNIAEGAAGTSLEVDKETAIMSIILNAAASILGEGAIQKAVVNSTGVSFANAPKKLEVGADVPADVPLSVGGKNVPATNLVAPVVTSGGISFGTGNTGNTGNTGDNSNTGGNSNTGNTGDTGDTGNTGNTSNTGDTGNSGNAGNTGNIGDTSNTGDNGNTGDTGNTGNNAGNAGGSETTGGSGSPGIPGNNGNVGGFFFLNVKGHTFVSGDELSFTSARDGYVYFTKEDQTVTDDVYYMDALVDAQLAIKIPVKANVTASVYTNDYGYGLYGLLAIDEDNNFSNSVYVTILDGEGTPLRYMYGGGQSATADSNEFFLSFNRLIEPVSGTDLHSTVTVATYQSNGVYEPLGPNDTVIIRDEGIVIAFGDLFVKRDIQVRIAANAIQTVGGEFKIEEPIVIYFGDSFTMITLADVDAEAYSISVPVGTVLQFTVTQPKDVYFVLSDTPWSLMGLEAEVTNGFGGKVEINEDNYNEVQSFDTSGFQAGEEYVLRSVWGGALLIIILE